MSRWSLYKAISAGLIKPTTPGDKTLFLLLVDDRSRFMWLILLQAKSEAAEAVKSIQARVEAECGRKIRVLCTNRGREFTSTSFGKYYDEFGIQRQLTTPYSPQQNEVVERQNKTIVGTAWSLLMTARMPGRFWGEAVMTTIYLYDPVGGRAHRSRDVIFDESTFWQWNDVIEADHNPNQFTVEYLVTEPKEGEAQHQEPSPPLASAPPEPMEYATPRTADSTLDTDHDA